MSAIIPPKVASGQINIVELGQIDRLLSVCPRSYWGIETGSDGRRSIVAKPVTEDIVSKVIKSALSGTVVSKSLGNGSFCIEIKSNYIERKKEEKSEGKPITCETA